MISLDIIPPDVVLRARALLRASGETIQSASARSGISQEQIGRLRAPRSAPVEHRSAAVRYLRTVHGLPAKLSAEESAQVRSLLTTMTARRGECAALARSLGLSPERLRQVTTGLTPPGVLIWAAFFPKAIGCHDIIVSPTAAIARAA